MKKKRFYSISTDMKIDDLKFTWQYEDEVPRPVIICTVRQGEKFLANGTATVSHKDQYERETGRRVSLQHALIFTAAILHPLSNEERKKFRARVWEVYRTMTKKPRWTPKAVAA